jgi:hypothetical protein
VAKLLVRWLVRVATALVLLFVVVYVGDLLVFKMRGSPQAKVTVTRYLTIPLKGNKTEYDYQGTLDLPCAVAIFPQGGQSPCWQLRKKPIQNIAM